ncbi:MAG: TrkH family potassium uptake protein [Cyanobacteria bacterium P01_D01_bin.73]
MTPARTICLGFLAVIAIGTLLLCLPISSSDGTWISPMIALFTATSAVCVTGLSVVNVGEFYSGFGQLVLVSLVQIGGLGYMTATTLLLLLFGQRFALREKIALKQTLDAPGLSGIRNLVKSIIGVTLIFELTGVFLLFSIFAPDYGADKGLWLAIFHSINSFNNAGFSLFENSFSEYVTHPALNAIVSLLVIGGAIGYQVIMEVVLWVRSGDWRRQLLNQNVRSSERSPQLLPRRGRSTFSLNFKMSLSTSIALWVLGLVGFFLIEISNPNTFGRLDWGGKLIAAWFQSMTTRTAGFNTVDMADLGLPALFLTIGLMFVGASPGGTGGGIKTTTIRILMSCTKAVLHGKEEIICYRRQIPMSLVLKAIATFMGSLGTVLISTTLITFVDPEIPFIQVLFECISAFATVGLSMGITANLSLLSKLVLIATMYLGRVGVLLFMGAIVGESERSLVRYPEENLLVG